MKNLKITIILLVVITFAGNLFSQEETAAKFLGISNNDLDKVLTDTDKKNQISKKAKNANFNKKVKTISSKCQTAVITKKEEKNFILAKVEDKILENRNDSIVYFATQFLGTKYSYGGMSPKTGFDCSGFVGYVFLHFGVKLPRSSKYFKKLEKQIKKENCQKADILVFAGSNPQKTPIGHVALVISTENNDIEFIHASTGRKSIIITKLSNSKYYQQRLVSIVRK